jgi:uncharacterized lipoprotein NlpE involved in copper resistance
MIKKSTIVLAAAVFFFLGCYNHKEETLYGPLCEGDTPSFATVISPIIQTKCSGSSNCHGTGSVKGPGALVTWAQINAAAAGVKSAVVGGTMPPRGPLAAEQIQAINCWVNAGAPNN